RGLPESWVMMTLSRSTVRMRSRDHAVLVDGDFLGVEMLSPFSEPRLLSRRDFLLERGERIAAAGPLLPADLGDDRVEHQRSVTDHGMVDAVLLVDVGSVVGGMDDGLTDGHAGPERGAGEARTDGQHEIGFRHELGEHLRPRARGRS